MVQFVKPNLLGNRKEFNNRFIHPIYNGQFEDSTAHDVRVMKRRAHVLHKMLEASVQVCFLTVYFIYNTLNRLKKFYSNYHIFVYKMSLKE